jgi:hypothetical protein
VEGSSLNNSMVQVFPNSRILSITKKHIITDLPEAGRKKSPDGILLRNAFPKLPLHS